MHGSNLSFRSAAWVFGARFENFLLLDALKCKNGCISGAHCASEDTRGSHHQQKEIIVFLEAYLAQHDSKAS